MAASSGKTDGIVDKNAPRWPRGKKPVAYGLGTALPGTPGTRAPGVRIVAMATASTLADRQRQMRERHAALHNGTPNPEIHCPATEKHYTPEKVGELWGFSAATIRRLFEDEPGVVVLGSPTPNPGKKRRRMFLRIPEGVMERKHRELVNK